MANPNTITRPWFNLESLGLRVLHARDNKGRHMLMLAPFDYEESPQQSQERLDGYKARLAAALKAHQDKGVRGSFLREGRFAGTFAFTGEALGQFRTMAEVIRTAFPETRLAPDTPAHFIRLPQYIQYRQQLRLQEARKELADHIAEVNRYMPEDRAVVLQDNQVSLVDQTTNEVVHSFTPASGDNVNALYDLAYRIEIEQANPPVELNKEYLGRLEELLINANSHSNTWVSSANRVQARALGELLYDRQEHLSETIAEHLDSQSDEQLATLLEQVEALAGVTHPQVPLYTKEWSAYRDRLTQEIQNREKVALEKERQEQEAQSQEETQSWNDFFENVEKENQQRPPLFREGGLSEAGAPEIEQVGPENQETQNDGDAASGDEAAAAASEGSPEKELEDLIELRDAMEDQLDRQGPFKNFQLVNRLSRVEARIAELEGARLSGESGRGNGQESDGDSDGWRPVGENADGVALYEDGRGVRALEEMPGIMVTESVGLAFTRHGIEAHRAERKDSYRTVEEMAERGEPELTEGQMVRAAFLAQEADLGEAVGVTVEFEGQTRSFLVTQKHPTPSDGHRLPTLNVRHLRPSTDAPERMVDDYLVTPRNTLERQGLAKKATPAFEVKWQQAGLALPALAVEEVQGDELESPYHRSVTPLTYFEFELENQRHTQKFVANQSALEKARGNGDSSQIDTLMRQQEALEWELSDILAGYMMTALNKDDRDPRQWPSNRDILALAEHYPALAERFSEVTGTPVMPGPWPKTLADLREVRELLKVGLENDPENPILQDRLLDVEADIELAAYDIPRSGWGNGQYMNRDNPVLGAQNRDNLTVTVDEPGDDHATGATTDDNPQSGGSPVERTAGGPAAAGQPGAGDGAGEDAGGLTPGADAQRAEGSGGSDGLPAGAQGGGAGTNDATAGTAEGAGRDGSDDDRGSVREGTDGSVRSGTARGDARGSSEDGAALGAGSEGTGEAEPAPAGGSAQAGGPGDAAAVREGAGAAAGAGSTSPAQGQGSDGGDDRGEPRADERDGAGNVGSGGSAGEQPARVTGFRFPEGHDHEGKTRAKRVDDNIAALETLFEVEAQGRKATAAERAIMAEYSGWGGIHPNLFGYSGSKPGYADKADKAIRQFAREEKLSHQEHSQIRGSVLNAHYTHSGIIRPMWNAIERLGVPTKRILDPSCGSLNFKSYMPESLAGQARFTAIELDGVTARLAKQIHPDAHIHQTGYEDAPVRENFFDVAISNIPFGEYKVFDRKNPRWDYSIHNYFFMKSLKDLKPGGVTAFVTSTHTMDAQNPEVRRAIAENAHLIGAVRLPAGAFSDNTQTDVQTDILFLQKKGDYEPSYTPKNFLQTARVEAPLRTGSPLWVDDTMYEPGQSVTMSINQYFQDHPEHVLGELAVKSGPHGPVLSAEAKYSIAELEKKLGQAFETFPSNITMPASTDEAQGADSVAEQQQRNRVGGNTEDLMPGTIIYSQSHGDFRTVVVNAEGEAFESDDPVKVPKKDMARMQQLTMMMGTARQLLILQSQPENPETEQEITVARDELNAIYDAFRAKFGPVNTKANEKLFRTDPRAPFLYGLENEDDNGELQKSDVFFKRVVDPTMAPPTDADNLEDALALSLAYNARVSLPYIRDLLSQHEGFETTDKVRDALLAKGLVFINPETEQPETPDVYLSGNLRPKLDLARESAGADPIYERNIKALEEVWPAPLKPSQIKVGIDAGWLPREILEQFIREQMEIPVSRRNEDTGTAKVEFDDLNRHWRMGKNGSVSMAEIARRYEQSAMHRWGTERCHAFRILDHAFTNTMPTVRDKVSENPDKYVVNTLETQKAQAKLEDIKDAFDQWVWRDSKRARQLTDLYNSQFNTMRLVEPNGDHMVYPGMAPDWVPRKHQNDFVWRAVSGKNALTAHVVGAGKTMQLIGTGIRGKQLGRWKKPMAVVPNHMLRQFAADAQKIYPSARILVIDKKDISPKKRAEFVAKAAMGDWDLVVCTHSTFGRIGVPSEFEVRMMEQEKENLEDHLRKADKDNAPRYKERDIQSKLKKLDTKLKKLYHQIEKNREDTLNLEQMGVDFIALDEAHYYKNLQLDSAQQIPGVSASDSVRAWDMFMKCRYLQEVHGGPYGVMMATGTPISNSITELYTFTRMMRPDLLEEAGIQNFNDWVGLYGEVKFSLETKPEGGGVQLKGRLSQFKNVPELIQMVRQFIDFKTREDLNLPSPEVDHETITAEPSEVQREIMKYIEARARGVRDSKNEEPSMATQLSEAARGALYGTNDKRLLKMTESAKEQVLEEKAQGKEDQSDDDDGILPMDILLSIASDGRKASLDPRLIHPDLPDDPNSKVNLCVKKCLEIHEKYAEDRAAQMIFCDFSSPTGKGIFNVYDDIKAKLIAGGVAEEEIAFIHDAKNDDDKEALFEKVRNGEVRFLLGSTMKMGVGTNVQERLVAMHQLDPPWKPADIEQRLGRMERQGNMYDQVMNFQYVTKDSFDLFMWETLNRKLNMIRQAMRKPEEAERELEEDTQMGFEDILAAATGNPKIRDFIEARVELDNLKRKHDNHIDEQADIGGRVAAYQDQIASYEASLAEARKELELIQANTPLRLEVPGAVPGIQDGDTSYIGGLNGLAAALEAHSEGVRRFNTKTIGTFGGLEVEVDLMGDEPSVYLKRLDGTRQYCGSPEDRDQGKLRLFDKEGNEKKARPPFYGIANKLLWKVRTLSEGNHIEHMEDARKNRIENLEQTRKMEGMPFPQADRLKEVQELYQKLAEELGDQVDQDKGMPPEELMPWLERIKDLPRVDLEREMRPLPESVRRQLGLMADVEMDDLDDGEGAGISLA